MRAKASGVTREGHPDDDSAHTQPASLVTPAKWLSHQSVNLE